MRAETLKVKKWGGGGLHIPLSSKKGWRAGERVLVITRDLYDLLRKEDAKAAVLPSADDLIKGVNKGVRAKG